MLNLFKGIIYLKNLLEAPIYPETTDMVIESHSLSLFFFFFFIYQRSFLSCLPTPTLCGEPCLLTLGVPDALCPCRSHLQNGVKSNTLPSLVDRDEERSPKGQRLHGVTSPALMHYE